MVSKVKGQSASTARNAQSRARPGTPREQPARVHFRRERPLSFQATVAEELLGTVDNPVPGPADVLRIESGERTGELAVRLGACRTVYRLAATPGDYEAIAASAADRHRAGTLSLVVLNMVKAARAVFAGLQEGAVPCTLLHSRFRSVEREELIGKVIVGPGEAGTSWWRLRSWRLVWTWMPRC
jgi:hypothetical protein